MLKVFEIVHAAYVFVWRERFNFVLLASLIVVATATVSYIGKSVVQSGAAPNALQLLTMVVLGTVQALLQLLFFIVWHRRYLVPGDPTTFFAMYRSGLQQHRFIIMGVLAYILAAIVYFFLATILVFIMIPLSHVIDHVPNIFVDSKNAMFHPMYMLKELLLFLPLVLLFSRLSLMFPAAAVGRYLSMSTCWQATKGQAWPLFFTLVFAVLPALFAGWLFGGIAERLVKLAGTSNVMIEHYAGALVDHFFTFVAIAMVATTLSIIYTAKLGPEAMQPDGTVELTHPKVGHGYSAVFGLIGIAILIGIIIGGLSLIAGFFGPLLIAPDQNLGPFLGFLVAPLGFLLGILLVLLWNARKAAKFERWPRFIYFAFLGAFLVGIVTVVLSTNNFFASFWRMKIAEMLPSQVKRLSAPGGVLKIWLVGVPVSKRQHILDKKLPIYVGGPLSNLGGTWDARFIDPEDFIQLHRQERARGQGPDIVVGEDERLFTEFLANSDFIHRLPEVRHFSFRALGPYAYADRDSKNFKLVRNLALSNTHCWRIGEGRASQSLKTELGKLPTDLAIGFLSDDFKMLADYSDPQDLVRLKDFEKRLRQRPRIDLAKFCHVWGTPSLASAEVFINYESTGSIGRTKVFLAMQKTPTGWRLLEAADNCESINVSRGVIPRSVCK